MISEGQLSNIFDSSKRSLSPGKNELLTAGIAATGQLKVDDTGARHRGRNGYSTIIGNAYFIYIASIDSKSRINFLRVLHGESPQYLINENAIGLVQE